MRNIEGDSAEYEFLTQGIELSKHVKGMAIEIGLRMGLGTKTIIDAVRQYCPDKTVVAVDPYGSILYKPRNHMPECRLDYTNQMKFECLAALYAYLIDNPVDFNYYPWTDFVYFSKMGKGVPSYNLEEIWSNQYSFVHLDGPHSVEAVNHEIDWFAKRMLPGAILCIDDITPDFIPIEVVEDYMGINDENGGFERIKKGLKKAIYKRV